MERITLDFETYYDKDYSLRKMTPVEYILDPRFEVILLSVKRPGRKAFTLSGDKIAQFFQLLDPNKTVIVTHNALFDMCICAWIYGFVPKLMICTMSMARAHWGHKLPRVALEVVAPFAGVGYKGKEVLKMVGLHARDIVAMGLWKAYSDYCENDSVLAEGIFEKIMAEGFPANEILVMNLVLRMAVIPQFELDNVRLNQHLNDVQTEKQNLLARAMLVGASGKSDLMSNEAFAQLLRGVGVEPPTKISPATGRQTYAFAKSDQEFTDLEEHPNPAVQALVAARLGHKSTIEETRTQRLINCSLLTWPQAYMQKRGYAGMSGMNEALMPMPLRYGGAHTHRLSGDWKLNVQNFPSRNAINNLKCSLKAPPGYTVMNIDSSQIEARIVAWLAGETDLLNQFERKLDPYKIFAAKVFGIDVSQVTKEQRFLGKTSILGLGFGLGWVRFKEQVRVKSLEAIRYSGTGNEIILEDTESVRIVNTYRGTYMGVPALWKRLNNAIPILAGAFGSFSIGPCEFMAGKISLPNGLYLHYHNLRQISTANGIEWVYDHGGKPRRLYGGALLENIVQALARIIVMDAATRIAARLENIALATLKYVGIDLALQVHDALVYVVPDEVTKFVGDVMLEEMNRRPAFAPELPLAAELTAGPSYGDCH
jgi:hypothetical protein